LRWRTSLQPKGMFHDNALVVLLIKNRIFLFADMLLFLPGSLIFNIVFDDLGSSYISYSSI